MNVRVINLSYGTDGAQDWRVDPLTTRWRTPGTTGSWSWPRPATTGSTRTSLADPAADPHVLAVGADDNDGTAGADRRHRRRLHQRRQPPAPLRRARAGQVRRLAARPGLLRRPAHPEGLVSGPAQRFFRGSGTSQAAAVVAGEAALLFQAQPKLTPDQVKTS